MARSPRNSNDRESEFTVSGDGASERARSILQSLDLDSPEEIHVEITHGDHDVFHDTRQESGSEPDNDGPKLPKQGTIYREAIRTLASAPETWLTRNELVERLGEDVQPNTISGCLSTYTETGTLDRRKNGNGYKYSISDELCRQELLAEAEQEGEL
jgi:hypothetical protein